VKLTLAVTMAAISLFVPGAAAGSERIAALSIRAEAANGYRLWLDASDRRSGDFASVELTKGRASVLYVPRGRVRVTARKIRFRLGALGRVHLRFKEQRRSGSEGELCQFALTERRGHFNGLLRFEGEDGFSRFEAHKVNGSVLTLRHARCHGDHRSRRDPAIADRRPERQDQPFIIACGPADGVLLFVQRLRPFTAFGAFADSRTRFADIQRSAIAYGDVSRFKTSNHLAAAEIHPPGPLFSGTATYSDGMTSGNLTALLPGLGRVPVVPGAAVLSRDYRVDPPPCLADKHRLSMKIGHSAMRQELAAGGFGGGSRARISK
jgi:hypothetical protein